jgi:hypothetical protein
MERYCSFIGASVKSRRYPYANIARRIRDVAQLRVIREIYDLHNRIRFGRIRRSKEEKEELCSDQLPDCKSIKQICPIHIYSLVDPGQLLLTPSSQRLVVTTQLRNQIIKYLATAFNIPAATSKGFIPTSLEQWARMRIAGGGDLIHARGYHKLRVDGRDASFVRVCLALLRHS